MGGTRSRCLAKASLLVSAPLLLLPRSRQIPSVYPSPRPPRGASFPDQRDGRTGMDGPASPTSSSGDSPKGMNRATSYDMSVESQLDELTVADERQGGFAAPGPPVERLSGPIDIALPKPSLSGL